MDVYRFALGVSGITVSSMVVTQADKIVLSRVLSLEYFGYYSLASVAASALAAMNAPVFNAIFPRLTALVAQRQGAALRPLFRLASQCVAVACVPIVLVVALFSSELVAFWTGDLVTAHHVAPVLAVLVVGTGLNVLMNLPYALQLAHGWTQLAFRLNLVFAVAIVPGILIAVDAYGAIGAAFVWVAVNAIYVVVGVPATHKRLFGDTGWDWFFDLGRVVAAAATVVTVFRLVYFVHVSTPVTLVVVTAAAVTGTAAAAVSATCVREWTVAYLSGRLSRFA
jgi:O-antigen/teichoic acid export membrane protein